MPQRGGQVPFLNLNTDGANGPQQQGHMTQMAMQMQYMQQQMQMQAMMMGGFGGGGFMHLPNPMHAGVAGGGGFAGGDGSSGGVMGMGMNMFGNMQQRIGARGQAALGYYPGGRVGLGKGGGCRGMEGRNRNVTAASTPPPQSLNPEEDAEAEVPWG